MKTCTKCRSDKPVSEFYSDGRRSDGLTSWCRRCVNDKCRKWQDTNRERDLANKRKYIRTKRQDAEYVAKEREAFSEWQRTNRSLVVDHCRRRRAKRANAAGSHTLQQLEARLEFYGRQCYMCSTPWDTLPERNRTWDHVMPLSEGGSDWASNLRPACRSCNSRKKNT